MPGEEIGTIVNRHAENCGDPPNLNFDNFAYVSYFENTHREQSLFLYDSDEDEVIVYVADSGWDNPQKLSGRWLLDNTLPSSDIDQEVLIDRGEAAWLEACKTAVEPIISEYQE